MQRLHPVLAALVATLVLAPTAAAAAPRFILVSGRELPRPVLLDDRAENHRLLVSTLREGKTVTRRFLARRPSFDIAMFWGPGWEGRRDRLSPRATRYHGRFWPAIDG